MSIKNWLHYQSLEGLTIYPGSTSRLYKEFYGRGGGAVQRLSGAELRS